MNSLRLTAGMGMYWANNRSTRFTNSAIQTHVAIMSAFREIEGNSPDTELIETMVATPKTNPELGIHSHDRRCDLRFAAHGQ